MNLQGTSVATLVSLPLRVLSPASFSLSGAAGQVQLSNEGCTEA